MPHLAVADRCPTPGVVPNTVVVSAESSETNETVGDEDSAYFVCKDVGIRLLKEVSVADGGPWADANTAVTVPMSANAEYRLTVTNVGNLALENVVVDDVFSSDPAVTKTLVAGDPCRIRRCSGCG